MFSTQVLLGPSLPAPSPAIPELAFCHWVIGPMGSPSDPEKVDSLLVTSFPSSFFFSLVGRINCKETTPLEWKDPFVSVQRLQVSYERHLSLHWAPCWGVFTCQKRRTSKDPETGCVCRASRNCKTWNNFRLPLRNLSNNSATINLLAAFGGGGGGKDCCQGGTTYQADLGRHTAASKECFLRGFRPLISFDSVARLSNTVNNKP